MGNPQPKPSAYLVIRQPGADRSQPLPDNALVQIGRSSGDIWLPDPQVSRRHAQLQQTAGGAWVLTDLASKNGTYVNGRRVDICLLDDRDIIRIGPYEMVFQLRADVAPTGEASTSDQLGPAPAGSKSRAAGPADPTFEAISTWIRDVRRTSVVESEARLLHDLSESFFQWLAPQRLAVGVWRGSALEWLVIKTALDRAIAVPDLDAQVSPRIAADDDRPIIELASPMPASSPPPAAPTALAVPLRADRTTLGVIYVEHAARGLALTPSQADRLSLAAAHAGILLEYVRMRQDRDCQLQVLESIRAARLIQTQLFPTNLDVHPQIELSALNLPSLEIRGDYYDFQLRADSEVAFIIADVMGRGLSAALLMAHVQALFRTGMHMGMTLEQVSELIDTAVHTNTAGHQLVSGVLGVVDVNRRRLEFLVAGHPAPSVLVGGQFREFDETLRTQGWGRGDARRPGAWGTDLDQPGWSILLFTDGVVEAPGLGGMYGLQRVRDAHFRYRAESAADLHTGVMNDVLAHAGSNRLEDDITLLVLASRRAPGRRPASALIEPAKSS